MLTDAHVRLPYPRSFGKHRPERLFRDAAEATGPERALPDSGMRRRIGSGNLPRLLASAGSAPAFGSGE